VYLHNTAKKPSPSANYHRPWSGPHKITAKISELSYEILYQNAKKQVVHINKLQAAHDSPLWKPKRRRNPPKKPHRKPARGLESEKEGEIKIGTFLVMGKIPPESSDPSDELLSTPEPFQQTIDILTSEHANPSYHLPETLKSKQELQIARAEPPVTRYRAKIMPQDTSNPTE
jgi:hypothetical protein